MDFDSESELISFMSQIISLTMSWESDSDLDFELATVLTKTISHVNSIDFDSMPKPQSKFISLIARMISLFRSMSDSVPEMELISLINQNISLLNSIDSSSELKPELELRTLIDQLYFLEPEPELISLFKKMYSLVLDMDFNSELKLIMLITNLMSLDDNMCPKDLDLDLYPGFISLIIQIISLVSSIDLDSRPKPETKLMSLVTQAISIFYSLDLDFQPKPLLELTSHITQKLSLTSSEESSQSESSNLEFVSLICQTLSLEPEPEFILLIHQIISLVISMNSEWKKLISLSPQVQVRLNDGKFYVVEELQQGIINKWECLLGSWKKHSFTGENDTHFHCPSCNGKNHEEYEKAPVEIIHPLHPKHSLQLVLFDRETMMGGMLLLS